MAASPSVVEVEEDWISDDNEEKFSNEGSDSEYGDNEEDFDFDKAEDTTENSGEVAGRKRKKKKANIDPSKRRRIRSIFRDDELQPETLEAQQEERERLKRLELQKSLNSDCTLAEQRMRLLVKASQKPQSPVAVGSGSSQSRSGSPLIFDFREEKECEQQQVIVIDSDDEVTPLSEPRPQTVQVISSDSEVEEYGDDEQTGFDYENSGAHTDDLYNCPDSQGRVLVNIGHPANEKDVFLAPRLARCVKPHQIGGIRFLYDNLVESLQRFDISHGFGCILAHAMGLGKTLQLIAFIDVFLRHTSGKHVLCVVPINTIQNWFAEFNFWLPAKPETIPSNENGADEDNNEDVGYREFPVYLLNDNQKTMLARAKIIGEWKQNGGVLLMGYELFRLFALATPSMSSSKMMPVKKKKSSNHFDRHSQDPEIIDLDEEEKNMDFIIGIQRAISRPGPDLVVCDEGHRIKNNSANISQALKKIRTRRRVVLTGYPLQNNLIEYWCMVDFVRPNFLGTKHEFINMFERPILNGQCTDSTPKDVKLMKYRSHVLHSLLEGFVQRRSQSVLLKSLPVKEEHVLYIKLSPIQHQLYNKFISFIKESAGHLNPIKGFHMCMKMWNHPDVFYQYFEEKKNGKRNGSPLTLLDGDFDGLELSSMTQVGQTAPGKLQVSSVPNLFSCGLLSPLSTPLPPRDQRSPLMTNDYDWASEIVSNYQKGVLEQSGKFVVLMEIVEESLKNGDKILVFSQSLSTLSVIEEFLAKKPIPPLGEQLASIDSLVESQKWTKNKTYFRLDGNTPPQEREKLINSFNSKSSEALLFLLSTRASSLGVNLIGANRVVVFDVSWNPCHDVQAICRVYRYGQKKPCHIYRLISTGTMEKKMYDRQVAKQGMSDRVVDELNPEANFTKREIMSLMCEEEPEIPSKNVAEAAIQFRDSVLQRICQKCSQWMTKVPFTHESLLIQRKENKLTQAEKKEAQQGYEMEKRLAVHGGRYYPNMVQKARSLPANRSQVSKSDPRLLTIPPIQGTQTTQNVTPSGDQPLRTSGAPYPLLTFPVASLVRAGIRIKGSTNTSNVTPGVLSTAGLNTNTSSPSSKIVQIDLTNSTDKHVLPVISLTPKQSIHSNSMFNTIPNANMSFQELFYRQQQQQQQQQQQRVKHQSMHAARAAGDVQPLSDLPLTAGLLTKNNCSDVSNTNVSTTATSTVVGDIDIPETSSNCAPTIESIPSEHEEDISIKQDTTRGARECSKSEGVVDMNGPTSSTQDNTAESTHLNKEPSVISSSINAQETNSKRCPNVATKEEPSTEKNSSSDSFCTDVVNPKDSKTRPESHTETSKLLPVKAN